MRERLGALLPVHRSTAVLMLAVPAVLWLFLVWDTRPYSREEIEADRAAAERDPAFARTVEACELLNVGVPSWTGDGFVTRYSSTGRCRGLALDTLSSLTREPLPVDEPWGAGTWLLVSMAAAMLLVGARWQPTPGVRSFLPRAGKVFLLGTVSAFVVGSTWWWALGWIAERRGVLDTGKPMYFITGGALLVGLAGVVGLALAVLLRGPVRVVATLTLGSVALGLAVLTLRPLEPWLPPLNIEAFLFGAAEYPRAPEVVSCDHLYWPSIYGSPDPASVSDVCTSNSGTRSSGPAAVYLFSSTLILTAAAALASVRRRGRGELGGPDPRRRVAP